MVPGNTVSTAAHSAGDPSEVTGSAPDPTRPSASGPTGTIDPDQHTPLRRVVWTGLREIPLSVDELLGLVTGPTVGGVGLFIGLVRDVDHGQPVRSLVYTAHPTADAELRRCADEVAARHPVETLAVSHRIGHLEIGDLAVVVAVGARHRGPALTACHELIDQLKQQVPVWKEQHFADGAVEWVGL